MLRAPPRLLLQAALEAMAAHRAFTMKVSTGTGANRQPPVMRLLFRPADGEGCSSAHSASSRSPAGLAAGNVPQAARVVDPLLPASAAAPPLLYFAVVHALEQAAPKSAAPALQPSPAKPRGMVKSASLSSLQHHLSREGNDAAAAEVDFGGGLFRDISRSTSLQVGPEPMHVVAGLLKLPGSKQP